MKEEKISANMKPSIMIDARNIGCYHLTCRKVIPNPADPKHPVIREKLMVLRAIDYKKYFECSVKDQIENQKTMNFEGFELVHDPSLVPEGERIYLPGPTEIKNADIEFKILKNRKKNKPATLGDIERALSK